MRIQLDHFSTLKVKGGRHFSSRLLIIVLAAFFLLFFVVGLFGSQKIFSEFTLFFSHFPKKLSESQVKLIVNKCIDDRPGDLDIDEDRCLQNVLEEIVTDFGTAEAQVALGTLYEDGRVNLGECHNIAHLVGRVTVVQKGIDEALGALDPFCSWGYLHGVFFALQSTQNWTIDIFAAKGGEACRIQGESETKKFLRNCFHGLGHGLTDFNPKDLIAPLKACDKASEDFEDRQQCQAGVFMQLARPNQGEKAYFYKEEDPFYPCDITPKEYRWACYIDVSPRAIYADVPFPDVVSLCQRIPDKRAIVNCMSQLYGSITWGGPDMEGRLENCRSLGDAYSKKCIKGVVHTLSNVINFDKDAPEQFCNVMVGAELAICQSALKPSKP
ncbi:hypothetical protein IH982_02130 [Patescibacteria group bacterium]|nr:hypothetical protein [Patescibacteria group bacterium]